MSASTRPLEFTVLLDDHRVRLRAFALSLVMNAADADDVFQSASITLWEKFDEFAPGSNFVAWAGRVVFLKAQQLRRRQGRDKLKFGEAYADAINRATLGDGDDVAGETDQEMAALGECVAKLNERHREVLRARYVEGADPEQIGKLIDRSASAVRVLLCRIRKSLFDCVTEKLRGGEPECQSDREAMTVRTTPVRGRPGFPKLAG